MKTKRLIDAWKLVFDLARLNKCGSYDHEDVLAVIASQKTVNAVEVVHGRWISYLDGDLIMPERYYRCSECCDRGWRREWPYCPNCGAKMDGDGNG